MRRGEAGFTVIEVLIVLAIAGMLLMGAFVAMTSSIESTRFNDTMTTVQSFWQKQYLEVVTGKSTRDNSLRCDVVGGVPTISTVVPDPTITPGGSDCILLGRMVSIGTGVNNDKIYSRYIVGTEPAVATTYTTDTQAVLAYQPRVVYAASDTSFQTITTFDVPWSADIMTAKDTSPVRDVVHFAIMRSPISERILVYSNATGALDATTLSAGSLNKKVDICIDSGSGILGRKGHLMIGAGQGQDLFTVERIGTTAC